MIVAQMRGCNAWAELTRWDSQWYAGIAEHGYGLTKHLPDGRNLSDYAFFPLYPLLERLGSDLTSLPVLVIGVAISVVAGVAAAVAIYRIGVALYGPRIGLLAVAIWASLPISIVESAAYTEALFTALAACALWAVIERRWLTAGTLALLAGLTRPTGVAVVLAVLVACLMNVRTAPRIRALLGCGLAPLGLLGYLAWVGVRQHHLTGYFTVTAGWHNGFDGGAAFIRWIADQFTHAPYIGGVLVLIVTAALIALTVRTRDQPLPMVVFTATILALALTTSGYFSSKPRYLLPLFSLLYPVAAWLIKRPRIRIGALLLLATSSCAFGAFWWMSTTPP